MDGIADIILNQMKEAGKRRISKSTSTLTSPTEPLDLGSILMMLWMSQMFKGKQPTTSGETLANLMPQRGFSPLEPMTGASPNVGVPTSTPQSTMTQGAGIPMQGVQNISGGIPLQAPKNLQELASFVETISRLIKMNPYG